MVEKKEIVKKIKTEIEDTKNTFKETIITLIMGGFGLVAALAWNEAIKSLFEAYLPKSGELIGKFVYAILVTFVVAIVSRYLKKAKETKQ
jgi:hypothetical protein